MAVPQNNAGADAWTGGQHEDRIERSNEQTQSLLSASLEENGQHQFSAHKGPDMMREAQDQVLLLARKKTTRLICTLREGCDVFVWWCTWLARMLPWQSSHGPSCVCRYTGPLQRATTVGPLHYTHYSRL